MKVVVLAAVLFLASASYANDLVKFKKDTVLPQNLQNVMIDAIEQNCEYILRHYWIIRESQTTQHVGAQDTLVTDMYYRTSFVVEATDLDGMHPYPFTMVVESIITDTHKKAAAKARVLRIDGQGYCKLN